MKSRREFLTSTAAAIGTVALGGIMLPILQSCAPTSIPSAPAGDQSTDANGFISVDVSDVTPANPAKRLIGVLGSDGRPIMVTLTADSVYHAFSAACTHETGTLNPGLTNGFMMCPLHLSQFDLNGVPTSSSQAKRRLSEYTTVFDEPSKQLKIKLA
jgi:Rieske Fe-S protein